VLLAYGLVIEGRRMLWTPEQGNKAFSPIFNNTNGLFFKEFLWLIFFLEIVPIMGFISGVLYCLKVQTDDP